MGVVQVCEECGSNRVDTQVFAVWDLTLQKWVLGAFDLDGNEYCHDCKGEARLIERPMDVREYAKLAIEKEEANGVSK